MLNYIEAMLACQIIQFILTNQRYLFTMYSNNYNIS